MTVTVAFILFFKDILYFTEDRSVTYHVGKYSTKKASG